MKNKNTPTDPQKALTVVGVIIPAKWDEDGNPIAISIATEDEKEFLIDSQTKSGKAIFNLMNQNVKITGILRGRSLNMQVIRVKEYTQL